MIEFCTKRRMLIGIFLLTLVSVVVLVVENNLSFRRDLNQDSTKSPDSQPKPCWDEEGVNSHHKEECGPCSKFDMKLQEACLETGYREIIECTSKNKTKTIYKSCPKLSWLEERNFWLFEGVTLLIGLGSYAIVCTRQKRLDKMLLEKVHKQIAAGI